MQDLWVIHEQKNNSIVPSTIPHCERAEGESINKHYTYFHGVVLKSGLFTEIQKDSVEL